LRHACLARAKRLSGRSDELGQVIFANSITLTPGTVSVRLLPGEIIIHALSEDGAADLGSGRMDRKVTGVEGDGEVGL